MELLGVHLDLGGALAAMTRLAAAEAVDALISIEPAVAQVMPPLQGPAARLANWLDGPYFENVRTAIAHRVLQRADRSQAAAGPATPRARSSSCARWPWR